MKTWMLARITDTCGGCGSVIKVGAPMLVLQGVGWRKSRCAACASEPVPDDIASGPSVGHVIRAEFGDRLASVRGLARDFKRAQGGD